MSVAVHAATPSGSDLGLFGGETDSSGTRGDGQIGIWGNWGTGTGSCVDMASITASISLANLVAEGDLGGALVDGLGSWIEFIILFKFDSL